MRKLRGAGCDVALTPVGDGVGEYVARHVLSGRHLGE